MESEALLFEKEYREQMYEEDPEASDLNFEEGEDFYVVAGMGECESQNIVIPAAHNGLPVLAVGDSAFKYCRHLTDVIIKGAGIIIQSYAFYGCGGMKRLELPQKANIKGATPFWGCFGLQHLVISADVKGLNKSTFRDCKALKSLTINGNHELQREFLRWLPGAERMVLAAGITAVGESAFCNRTGMTEIAIADSVIKIGRSAFSGCTALTDVIFGGTKAQWKRIVKGCKWDDNTPDYTVHCADGDDPKD